MRYITFFFLHFPLHNVSYFISREKYLYECVVSERFFLLLFLCILFLSVLLLDLLSQDDKFTLVQSFYRTRRQQNYTIIHHLTIKKVKQGTNTNTQLLCFASILPQKKSYFYCILRVQFICTCLEQLRSVNVYKGLCFSRSLMKNV